MSSLLSMALNHNSWMYLVLFLGVCSLTKLSAGEIGFLQFCFAVNLRSGAINISQQTFEDHIASRVKRNCSCAYCTSDVSVHLISCDRESTRITLQATLNVTAFLNETLHDWLSFIVRPIGNITQCPPTNEEFPNRTDNMFQYWEEQCQLTTTGSPDSYPESSNSTTAVLSSIFGVVGTLVIAAVAAVILAGFLLKWKKRKNSTVEANPHSLEQPMDNPVYDDAELQTQRNSPTPLTAESSEPNRAAENPFYSPTELNRKPQPFTSDVPCEYECPISTNPAKNENQIAENLLYSPSDVPRDYECPISTDPAKCMNQPAESLNNQPVKNPLYIPTEVPNTNAQPHPSNSDIQSLSREYEYPNPAVYMNYPSHGEPATGVSGTSHDADAGEYEQLNMYNPYAALEPCTKSSVVPVDEDYSHLQHM